MQKVGAEESQSGLAVRPVHRGGCATVRGSRIEWWGMVGEARRYSRREESAWVHRQRRGGLRPEVGKKPVRSSPVDVAWNFSRGVEEMAWEHEVTRAV